MASTSKMMDKDEQLQLCIQRFVSDTQSMINQFSELFISELRRFADVCMEFSVAYRGVQEDRQFLTAENKSLKDELDARTAEVDFLGKELREIREENDELIRKLECLNINSEGEISMNLSESARPRHYTVVNSMPAFPRRYSEAVGYEPSASSTGHREDVSIEFNLSTDIEQTSIPSTSKAQLLLTPPVGFKNITNSHHAHPSPSPNSADETTTNSEATRSHSRDDISLYSHLFKNDSITTSSQLGTLANCSQLTSATAIADHRSPSLDEMGTGSANNDFKTTPITQSLLSAAVSSSAGTFYDCCNQIRRMFGSPSSTNPLTNSDAGASSNSNTQQPTTLTTSKSSKVTPPVSPDVTIVHDGQNQNDKPNHSQTACAVVDVELKQLKKRHSKHIPTETTTIQQQNFQLDPFGNFIAKTPSPNLYSYNQHFDKYRCDADNIVDNNNDLSNENATGPGMLEVLDDVDAAFYRDATPVQRYNSKKISKKRKSRKKSTGDAKPEDDLTNATSTIGDNCDLQQNGSITPIPMSADVVSIIPSPQIDLNRYLLVEICHIISPSHFYLIVNDEKVGTNAFEDFLERFQMFYKSIEEAELNGGFADDGILDDEERELRLLVSIPPPAQALTIGSYWACYIDDELDWRRVQIIGVDYQKKGSHGEYAGALDEDLVMVKDVDSGYSSLVHSQMIRPLTPEMAQVPAFAIRASLAFIYPHLTDRDDHSMNNKNNSKDHLLNECYDQWPLECCQFFEDMTYDQILTASVLQIQQRPEDYLTETISNEVAQVLLWCTSAEDYEVFINRKLIELNYASNVADDDSWMEQFSDVVQPQSQQNLPQAPDSPNIETCFNIQLTIPAPETTVSASFQTDKQKQRQQQTTVDDKHQINNNKTVEPSTNQNENQSEVLPNNQTTMAGPNPNKEQRKIKIKTRSKKKKGPNECKEENKDCPDLCSKVQQQAAQPAVRMQTNGGEEDTNNNNSNSSQQSSSSPNQLTNHNLLLHLSPEPKLVQFVIVSTADSSNHIDNINIEQDCNESQIQIKQNNDEWHKSLQFNQALHHDPRLSNWIIQKHSRCVTLKKTSLDKISYLFRVTCFFEANKFIGILPFGEKKLDLEQLYQFVCQDGDHDLLNYPFKSFVQEMTDFYTKNENENCTRLRLLPEQCVFEQANSSTIVFYEIYSGLFLRGHIVGRDMSVSNEDDQRLKLLNEQQFNQSKSAKDLKVPNANADESLNGVKEKKKKTLSLKRKSMHNMATKYIIYAIDAGRYFQAQLKHIYHLDDRFKMTKPFAIVCKLHGFPKTIESSTIKLRKMVEDRFFGLRFIDIDFSTERFAVELYTLTVDPQNESPSSSSSKSQPKNIISQL